MIVCGKCGCKFTKNKLTYRCYKTVSADWQSCYATGVSFATCDKVVWQLVSEVYKDTLDADYLAQKKQPLEEELSKLVRDSEDYTSKRAELIRNGEKQYSLALKFQDTNPTLFEKAMAKIDELGSAVTTIDNEIEAIAEKVSIIESKIEAIDEGVNYEITENTEKLDFLHKVIDKMVLYGNIGNKVIQVFFKNGANYDLVFHKKTWYYFKNDGCVKYSHLPNSSSCREEAMIEVTTTNNGLFSPEVLGCYTMENFVGILKLHNLLKFVYKTH